MLTRLLDFVVGREPVATATGVAAVITAAAGLLTAFDVIELSGEQIAALGAFAAALAGWVGRSAVSPVGRKFDLEPDDPRLDDAEAELDRGEGA